MIIKIIIWIFILAYLHARQETEIEGKAGWARHLPTFRINIFITKLLLAKELTGYHIFLLLMFLTIFHLPLLFIPFTLEIEYIILGLMSFYWVLEDFLFFIVNPHYRFKNFKKGKISWHKRWFLGLPTSYWWGMIIGITLLILGGK
jgi:hypothetical protein